MSIRQNPRVHTHLSIHRKRDVDMTEGNITRHILGFAFPLLIGNIFQQLYTTVDTWVVGNYVNNEAFSAVGSIGPIVNMLIGLFLGLSAGAGVVISQNYGASRYEDVSRTVHTAITMTLILGVLFSGLGVALIPYMLAWMKTPAVVIPESTAYLTVYFSGVMGLMLYNIGSGILRAVGDSRRPFYYLVICAIMNTVLDLLFVIQFNMGVRGVALATVLSQSTSAVLVMITLMRSDSCIRLHIKSLRIHLTELKKILRVGIPTALQMAITSFSNIFVQSYINHFQEDCMSGWTAYGKIDQLLVLPMQSISLAATTFVGQNLGKNQVERARKGTRTAVMLTVVPTAILMIPVIGFAPYLVSFFNAKAEVIDYGSLFLRCLTPFYLFYCFSSVYAGALRGAGNSKVPMLITIGSFVVFRQIYLFAMSNICNQILPIAMGYPAGWILCCVVTVVYYHKVQLNKDRLITD